MSVVYLDTLNTLLAWMLENDVQEASMNGCKIVLRETRKAATELGEVQQPQPSPKVDLPPELLDPGAQGLMFWSSRAGPPEREAEAQKSSKKKQK